MLTRGKSAGFRYTTAGPFMFFTAVSPCAGVQCCLQFKHLAVSSIPSYASLHDRNGPPLSHATIGCRTLDQLPPQRKCTSQLETSHSGAQGSLCCTSHGTWEATCFYCGFPYSCCRRRQSHLLAYWTMSSPNLKISCL